MSLALNNWAQNDITNNDKKIIIIIIIIVFIVAEKNVESAICHKILNEHKTSSKIIRFLRTTSNLLLSRFCSKHLILWSAQSFHTPPDSYKAALLCGSFIVGSW